MKAQIKVDPKDLQVLNIYRKVTARGISHAAKRIILMDKADDMVGFLVQFTHDVRLDLDDKSLDKKSENGGKLTPP